MSRTAAASTSARGRTLALDDAVHESLRLHGPERWIRESPGTLVRTMEDGSEVQMALRFPEHVNGFASVPPIDFYGEWTATRASQQARAGAHLVMRSSESGDLHVAPLLDTNLDPVALDGIAIPKGVVRQHIINLHDDVQQVVGGSTAKGSRRPAQLDEQDVFAPEPDEAAPQVVATAINALTATRSMPTSATTENLISTARRALADSSGGVVDVARLQAPARFKLVNPLKTDEQVRDAFGARRGTVIAIDGKRRHIGITVAQDPTTADVMVGKERIMAALQARLIADPQGRTQVALPYAGDPDTFLLVAADGKIPDWLLNSRDFAAMLDPERVVGRHRSGNFTVTYGMSETELRNATQILDSASGALVHQKSKVSTIEAKLAAAPGRKRRKLEKQHEQATKVVQDRERQVIQERQTVETALARQVGPPAGGLKWIHQKAYGDGSVRLRAIDHRDGRPLVPEFRSADDARRALEQLSASRPRETFTVVHDPDLDTRFLLKLDIDRDQLRAYPQQGASFVEVVRSGDDFVDFGRGEASFVPG